jgi:hypothetical protein
MNILGYMQSTLYLIMNALLYPVMGLLIFLFILMLFISGAFVSEFAFHRKGQGMRLGIAYKLRDGRVSLCAGGRGEVRTEQRGNDRNRITVVSSQKDLRPTHPANVSFRCNHKLPYPDSKLADVCSYQATLTFEVKS